MGSTKFLWRVLWNKLDILYAGLFQGGVTEFFTVQQGQESDNPSLNIGIGY